MGVDPSVRESAAQRLERDLSEIEYLARVGPSEYGVEETLTRMRARTREARERPDTNRHQAQPPARPHDP